MIYSASHGVITIQEGDKGRGRWVGLTFRNPDVMTLGALRSYQAMRDHGGEGPQEVFSDQVPVDGLKALVEKVLSLKRKPPQAYGEPRTP